MIPGFVKVSDTIFANNLNAEINRRRKRPIYALSLNGVSGAVKVNAAASINDLTTISVFTKTKLTSAGENSAGRIYDKGVKYISTVTNNLQFQHNFTGNDGTWRPTINSITYNELYNTIITYDNTDVANDPIIYINGTSETITETIAPTLIANADAAYDLYIGNNNADSRTLNGLIYSFAYYNVILTPTQMSNLSNGSLSPKDISGCVLYHDYTLGHAQDLSGNNNNGTLKGNAQFIITGYD